MSCFILSDWWAIPVPIPVSVIYLMRAILIVADENRQIVVAGNYTCAIIRHVQNPELIHVVIPVIYNLCMDFGSSPAISMNIAGH